MRASKVIINMAQAFIVAERSTCCSAKRGCVLVDKEGHILSSGYNGAPAGVEHCTVKSCLRHGSSSGTNLTNCRGVHAEQNALIQCRTPDLVHAAYITISPCITCMKMFMNSGCQDIFFVGPYKNLSYVAQEWKKYRGEMVQVFYDQLVDILSQRIIEEHKTYIERSHE